MAFPKVAFGRRFMDEKRKEVSSLCFITLFVKKEDAPKDVENYTKAMKEVANKYCTSFNFKISKSRKRLTLYDLCEVKNTKNPSDTLKKMIAEINKRTNGTAGGWTCKKTARA